MNQPSRDTAGAPPPTGPGPAVPIAGRASWDESPPANPAPQDGPANTPGPDRRAPVDLAVLDRMVRADRQTIQRLKQRIARLETLLEVMCGDPQMQWLYRHRSERMDATVPLFDEGRARFHLARYEFACQFVRGAAVADIACGTGYGTELMVRTGGAARGVGIDICAQSIEYANQRHSGAGLEYIRAAADATPLEDQSTDVVVSFETLEHVADERGVVDEFHRVLRPGGVLVCSTPNQWPLDIAPHHLREYDLSGFRSALARRFAIEAMYNQNSGTQFKYNRDQPAGIVPTTVDNQQLAECYLAVARKPGSR